MREPRPAEVRDGRRADLVGLAQHEAAQERCCRGRSPVAERRRGAIPNRIHGAHEAAAAGAREPQPIGGEQLGDAVPAEPIGLPRRRPPQRPSRDDLAPDGQLPDRLVRLDQQGPGVRSDADSRDAVRATGRCDYVAADRDLAARPLIERAAVDRSASQRADGAAGDRSGEADQREPREDSGAAARARKHERAGGTERGREREHALAAIRSGRERREP